jgi:hypothetical protein
MLNVGGGIMVSALSASPGLQHSSSLTLSLEKLLHFASKTGDLNLAGRNLKEFPRHNCKFQLKDTVSAGKINLKLPFERFNDSLMPIVFNGTLNYSP